jgi:hypothetical protein
MKATLDQDCCTREEVAIMRGRTVVKWEVLLEDTDWDNEECPPVPQLPAEDAPATPISPRRRLLWSAVGIILMAAVSGSYLLWRTAQAGLQLIETELEQTIVLEAWTNPVHSSPGVRVSAPRSTTEPSAPAAVELESFDLNGEVACAEVVVEDPALFSPYRETRFYRQTELGWQRTSASPFFWGTQQEFQSEHFIFLASRRDLPVAVEAALALDAIYTRLCQDLGLSPTVGEKIIVEILTDPTTESDLYIAGNRLGISSFALHQMPVEFSEAEVLVQLVKVAFARHLLNEVAAIWIKDVDRSLDWAWGPLLTGLHLWLAQDQEGFLDEQYHDLVGWYYREGKGVHMYEAESLPSDYQMLCQICRMLGVDARNLAIPFDCLADLKIDGASYYILPPLTTTLRDLDSFYPVPVMTAILDDQALASYHTYANGILFYSFMGTNIASFTLIDYAVETYGRETLPVLMDALGTHPHWITVIPAVYGVSVAEFEAGWRSYLQEKYASDW